MTYLRNVWYVAAWASELPAGKLLPRRLLDEPLVFFRDPDGSPRALIDRCPHRFAPLSMGTLCEGVVQCRYHGLRFDSSGRCVHNPHGDVIPIAAQVKAYPMVERYSLLWIWMGDPARADAADIPEFQCQDPETWEVGEGYLHVKSDYRLENDNILDLSHIHYLHPDTLGGKSLQHSHTEVSQEGRQVWARRQMKGEVLNDALYPGYGLPVGSLVDRWIDVRWDPPATMWLLQTVVPAGQPRPQGGTYVPNAHIFTPETANTTHYWFSFCLEKAYWPKGAAAEKGMLFHDAQSGIKYLEFPFLKEDLPMLEAVHERMQGQDFWGLKPVLLAPDAAAVRVRRVLDKLIADEQSASANSGPAKSA